MSRIYKKTSKRIAKKHILNWKKIVEASKLKPGDLISGCLGYNEKIKEINPIWVRGGLSKGSYILDFDIVTESGWCCSVIHCCTFPIWTGEEVLERWKFYLIHKNNNIFQQERYKYIFSMIENNKNPFDDKGCLNENLA